MGNSAAKNQKNLENKNSSTLLGESQSLVPGLETGWGQVMAPLSPTDTAAIQQAGEGTTAQAFNSAGNTAANRAAASNNPVGQLDLQDNLARAKATAVGQQGLQDQATIDVMNRQNKETGLAGLGGLESGLQGGATQFGGQATSAANEQQATGFNWGNFLDSLVQGGAKVASAGLASSGGGGGAGG